VGVGALGISRGALWCVHTAYCQPVVKVQWHTKTQNEVAAGCVHRRLCAKNMARNMAMNKRLGMSPERGFGVGRFTQAASCYCRPVF